MKPSLVPVIGRWWGVGAALLGGLTLLLWVLGFGPITHANVSTATSPAPAPATSATSESRLLGVSVE